MGTHPITKVSIKKKDLLSIWSNKYTQRGKGCGGQRSGSSPRPETEFEFIFPLMSLIPYSIPEKKLWPEGIMPSYVCSAQILGFDILLMKNLKPMLLEVNANPSMRIEHEYEVSDCRTPPGPQGCSAHTPDCRVSPWLPKTCHP